MAEVLEKAASAEAPSQPLMIGCDAQFLDCYPEVEQDFWMKSGKMQVSALPPSRNREMMWKMARERMQLSCPVILMESWTENLSRENNGIAGPPALAVINSKTKHRLTLIGNPEISGSALTRVTGDPTKGLKS